MFKLLSDKLLKKVVLYNTFQLEEIKSFDDKDLRDFLESRFLAYLSENHKFSFVIFISKKPEDISFLDSVSLWELFITRLCRLLYL